MAGVKGRSGRRTTSDESKRLRVLQKAWEILESALDNPELPIGYKIDIASKLCVKNLPQEVQGMNMSNVIMMGEIKKGEEPLRFNVGEPIVDTTDPA